MYGFSNPKCIKGDELIKGKGFLMLSEYLLAALLADLKILIKHILFWGELGWNCDSNWQASYKDDIQMKNWLLIKWAFSYGAQICFSNMSW